MLQVTKSPKKREQLSIHQFICSHNHRNMHKFLLLQSKNFHIHKRGKEKRKHLHKTASTVAKIFSLRCLFYNVIVEQVSSYECITNFSVSERFPESKKQRRKGAISPGLFLTASLPSWLLGKCQRERERHSDVVFTKHFPRTVMVSFKAAAFLSNKLNALPKQFKLKPKIAMQSRKKRISQVKQFINECVYATK